MAAETCASVTAERLPATTRQGPTRGLVAQGPEADYAKGEEIAQVIWAPVMRSHRVSVEQMALLEPGLSETDCASLLMVMKDAVDEVVDRGVDRQAATDFLLGPLVAQCFSRKLNLYICQCR